MNQWECEECGAVATNRPRKNAIAFACDQRCRWVFNHESNEDSEVLELSDIVIAAGSNPE
jgi:rubredoxin